jgi:SAM-dependent methyltransferase
MDSARLTDSPIDLALLRQLQQPPAPFTPGAPRFWDDPHISAQVLAAHLDPEISAASRPPAIIERSVAWIVAQLGLPAGAAVVDLGCGPGLYAQRLATRGLHVTGIDFSQRSIAYATQQAQAEGLLITYRYEDYLALHDTAQYDAALLIYGDFCVLSPTQRTTVLGNVQRALRPGGRFVLDVTTPTHRERHGLRNGWEASAGGFWRPGPHLVLTQGFAYPDQAIFLDQYSVIDPDGTLTVYRNWFQDYTPETITAELEAHGFAVVGLWSDLVGTPLSEASEWIGVECRM